MNTTKAKFHDLSNRYRIYHQELNIDLTHAHLSKVNPSHAHDLKVAKKISLKLTQKEEDYACIGLPETERMEYILGRRGRGEM